jgi:hypothetical protein
MKRLLTSLLLVSTAAFAYADESTSLSGHWQIDHHIADNESHLACTFAQNGNDLTGNCNSNEGGVRSSGKITGKVDAKTVTWTYKSEYNGGPVTLDYKGTLDSATKITGTVNVEEYDAEGEFTATLSK